MWADVLRSQRGQTPLELELQAVLSHDRVLGTTLGFPATAGHALNHWALTLGLVWFHSPGWPWVYSGPLNLAFWVLELTGMCQHTSLGVYLSELALFCLTLRSPIRSIVLQMTQLHSCRWININVYVWCIICQLMDSIWLWCLSVLCVTEM